MGAAGCVCFAGSRCRRIVHRVSYTAASGRRAAAWEPVPGIISADAAAVRPQTPPAQRRGVSAWPRPEVGAQFQHCCSPQTGHIRPQAAPALMNPPSRAGSVSKCIAVGEGDVSAEIVYFSGSRPCRKMALYTESFGSSSFTLP